MRRVRRPLVASQSECEKPPQGFSPDPAAPLGYMWYWCLAVGHFKDRGLEFRNLPDSPLDIHYLMSHEQGIMDAHSGYLEGLGLTRFVLS